MRISDWSSDVCSSDLPAIQALRDRVLRSMLATVFFSNGTPMLLAGDEFGNSQGGNNNAYCQDNETSWLDWEQASEPAGRGLTAFLGKLAGLRRTPLSFRQTRFIAGGEEILPCVARMGWLCRGGQPLRGEYMGVDGGVAVGLAD